MALRQHRELILIATGSEVSLVLEARRTYRMKVCRLVLFQCRVGNCSKNSRRNIETKFCRPTVMQRVAVEAGVRQGWDRYVGPSGVVVGWIGLVRRAG